MIRIPFCDHCGWHRLDCPCHTHLDPAAERRELHRIADRHRHARALAAARTLNEAHNTRRSAA